MSINLTSSKVFNRLENILIIGNGGREISLGYSKNELVQKVYIIPGMEQKESTSVKGN